MGSIKVMNLAPLAKWWWRYQNDKNALWLKIIDSLYEVDGGLVDEFEVKYSSTCVSIIQVGKDIDQPGANFSSSMRRVVASRDATKILVRSVDQRI